MTRKLIAGGALTGLVLAGGVAGLVSAQTVADATGLTESQVIEIALMEVPGKVTEVERERKDGQQVFEVEILGADGFETDVYIAAATGEVLKVDKDGTDDDGDHDRNCDGDDEDDDTDDA